MEIGQLFRYEAEKDLAYEWASLLVWGVYAIGGGPRHCFVTPSTNAAFITVSSPRNTLCVIISRFSSLIVRVVIPQPA
jgi:hypothetical protein